MLVVRCGCDRNRGFTIIEVLIATFIIGVVITGLFGLFVLSLRTVQDNERRIAAVALANERVEMIRNLPYADVGTDGGIPSGSIPQEETVVRNSAPYVVRTDIRYVDDPYDGVAGGDPSDLLNTDYKQVRVEVSWNSPTPVTPILLITSVVPQGIEGGDAAGTLVFEALDASGVGLQGADVQVVNESVNPTVNISTQTNDEGRVIIPGLPDSANSYMISVSEDGYTQEQTYDETETFFPDPDHTHLSALVGEVTEKTFLIDRLSSIALNVKNDAGDALGGIDYHLSGTKSIGTDENEEIVYVFDEDGASGAGGSATHENMVWDLYELTIDGVATGYDIKETSELLPLDLEPGEDVVVDVVLVDHTDLSLHLTVVTALGEPIGNADVTLVLGEYEEHLQTGEPGQVFFSDLPQSGSYSASVEAEGYQMTEQEIQVSGTDRVRIELSESEPE